MVTTPGQRVVICSPGFPASIEDTDKPFLLNQARAIVASGLKVTVVCPAIPGLSKRQVINGVEIIRVRYGPRRLETLASTGAMYREARGWKALLVVPMILSMLVAAVRELRRGPSVAYGHWWVPGGVVAVTAARLSGKRSVVHLHGSDVEIAKTKLMGFLARIVLRFADQRLAASDELAHWSRQLCDRDVQILPMPLDFDRLPTPSPVPSDGYVLGVGRLVPEKGFDVLIDAVGTLEESSRPQVVVIGNGPEREVLVKKAAQAGVDLHLPGAVSPTELGHWYQRSRIVAVPSIREGFGLVAAEAAAAGRAVVASAVGGIPEVVVDGLSGILVRPGNVEDLAAALQSVDPRWGANGPRRVSQLGMDAHGHAVNGLCEKLIR